ncbi:MAG: efflux RND transporter periplasmic adaptor subunit [Alistipes sp.]|nr:efflux RND transporter periplasmic adaptor subunit [Alistipes sp.]
MYKSLIIGLIVLLTVGCKSKNEKSIDAPIKVETLLVGEIGDSNQSTYVGVLEEKLSSSLSFPVSGVVLKTFVNEGERVAKGDILATLDDNSMKQMYATAEATLHQAQDAYKRMKLLYEAESLPEIKWIEIQTQLQQAESSFEIVKRNLEDCTLKAPFSGVIGKKLVTTGENVLPGAPVMILLDVSQIKVRFAVPEQEVNLINNTGDITVHIDALDNKDFIATNIEKSPAADAISHTYDIKATIKTPQKELLPGMVCSVEIDNPATDNMILLPLRCVTQTLNNEHFVWKVLGDSVTRQKVTLGKPIGNSITVIDGVQSGDRIVTKGMEKIGEGDKIVW